MTFEAEITGVNSDGVVMLTIKDDIAGLVGLVGKKVTVNIQEIYQFDAGTSTCRGVDVGDIFYTGA